MHVINIAELRPVSRAYEFHPYAEIWPLLDGEEFEKFKADIAAHGQHMPILIYDDKVIDGRNRYNACTALGVMPQTEPAKVKNDAEALELVMSLNDRRRHMNEEERAFAAARYATIKAGARKGNRHAAKKTNISADTFVSEPEQPESAGGVTIVEAADRFKVSKPAVARARQVIKYGDADLEKAVTRGKKKLSVAAREVTPPRPAGKPKPGPKPQAQAQAPAPRKWGELVAAAIEAAKALTDFPEPVRRTRALTDRMAQIKAAVELLEKHVAELRS